MGSEAFKLQKRHISAENYHKSGPYNFQASFQSLLKSYNSFVWEQTEM